MALAFVPMPPQWDPSAMEADAPPAQCPAAASSRVQCDPEAIEAEEALSPEQDAPPAHAVAARPSVRTAPKVRFAKVFMRRSPFPGGFVSDGFLPARIPLTRERVSILIRGG